MDKKREGNPMVSICGAKARTNGNQPCRKPAMKNGRCDMHGGKSTGPRTKEGLERLSRINTKHGRFTKAARAEAKQVPAIIKEAREVLKQCRGLCPDA